MYAASYARFIPKHGWKFFSKRKWGALFKGFAFRVKRKRALAKLSQKGGKGGDLELEDNGEFDDLMGDNDFDAEAFLNVKQENLEKADIFSGANASLMEKYIQVLSFDQKQKNQQRAPLPPAGAPGFNHPGR